MSALGVLRTDLLKQRQQEEIEKQNRLDDAMAAFRRQVSERIGIDILSELFAEFGRDDNCRFWVKLCYRDRSKYFYRPTETDVVDWTFWVDREIEKSLARRVREKDLMIHRLRTCGAMWDYRRLKRQVETEDLLEFDDLRQVLESELERIKKKDTELKVEAEANVEQIIQSANELELEIGWEQEIKSLQEDLGHCGVPIDDDLGRQAKQAILAADDRLTSLTQEREEKRMRAQAGAFLPFCTYLIHFGIVAHDEYEGRFVDTGVIESLSPDPDADGWFESVYGLKKRPLHICLIERRVHDNYRHIPRWCPSIETEYGKIRVPPTEADFVNVKEQENEVVSV